MQKIFLVFLILFFISCSKTSNIKEIENKALDSISVMYDGKIEFSKGLIFNNSNKINYVELSLSNSNTLKNYYNFKYLPPSNIALIFYSLSKETNNKYDLYKVNMNYGDENKKYEYSDLKLQNALIASNLSLEIIKDFKKNNFNGISDKIIVNNHFSYDKEKLIEKLKSYAKQKGEINKAIITGFTNHTVNADNFKFVKIYGFFVRNKNINNFSFFIDTKLKQIFYVDFSW